MQTYKHAHGFNDKFFVFTFHLFRCFLCTLRWRVVQVGQPLNVHILPDIKNNDLHKGQYTLCFLISTMRMIRPSTTILDSPKSHGVTTCDSLLTNHFFPHKTLSTTSQQQKRGVFFTENPDVYKLTSHQTKCPFFPQFQHPNPNSNQLTKLQLPFLSLWRLARAARGPFVEHLDAGFLEKNRFQKSRW